VEHKADLPVIGEDISWEDLSDRTRTGLLKVTHFTEFATVVGDKVISPSRAMPYGVLTLDCLELGSIFTLSVVHRLDFLNLWRAKACQSDLAEFRRLMKERISRFETKASEQLDEVREIHTWLQNTQGAEILVGAPDSRATGKRSRLTGFLGSSLPRLRVWICPEGYLQRGVSNDFAPLSGELYFEVLQPLVEWVPRL
jgi:hypothetical protein